MQIRNLSALCYANGFTLWHYKAGVPRPVIADRGYFNDARDMMASGDMILVSGAYGAAVVHVHVHPDGLVTTAPIV